MNSLKQYAKSLPERIKQTGNRAPEPSETCLRAGSLTMKFSNGALRYISSGRNELLRMIYAAVRDRDWLTIPAITSNGVFEIKPDSFFLKYTCRYISNEIDFTANFEITGNKDNSITLCMEGKANSTFRKNRIGLCVLHPVESCSGKPCYITHTNGPVERTAFPESIHPYQPFLDIKSMSWPAFEGTCFLDFEGDVFETEDQRNWTDSSYKTYSTPLSLSYPVRIEEGTVIRQKINFRTENIDSKFSSEDESVKITVHAGKLIKMPAVGIGRSSRPEPLTDAELRILRLLRFNHYRLDVHLFENNWHLTAGKAINEAAEIAAKMEFALFFDDNFESQIKDFITWFKLKKPATYCFLIFHKSYPTTPGEIAIKVIPVIRNEIPGIRIGSGTNANFAQLNRSRTTGDNADLVCFSLQPQEHASDNRTLIENLRGQEYAAKSTAGFARGHRIWLSPVNIQRRFNANNTFIEEPFSGSGFPPQADVRIMSLFGACWTAISLKYLFENEITGVTYYETVGERGIMQGECLSRWPVEFPSCRGMIFPIYFIFKFLQRYRSFRILRSSSSSPLVADSLTLSDGKQVRMILTNFNGNPKSVKIIGCKGMLRIRELNTFNYSEAVSNHNWTGNNCEKVSRAGQPLNLEPFSISFIDGWLKK